MAMEGLWVLVCASTVIAAPPTDPAAPLPGGNLEEIKTMLAVQTAMQEGSYHLAKNNPRAAVETLEKQLPRINGDAKYLTLLRDAYRAYIKELRLTKQDALAQHYSQLLAILEPGSAPAAPVPTKPVVAAPGSPPPAPAKAMVTATPSDLAAPAKGTGTGPAASPATPSKSPVVRLKREEEDDFFKEVSGQTGKKAGDLLGKAKEAFNKSQYREA